MPRPTRQHLRLIPSACGGELVPRGRFVDRVVAPGGGFRQRTVEVLRCESCPTFALWGDGRPLNAYNRPPQPEAARGMVEDLAGAMDGRGRVWTEDKWRR